MNKQFENEFNELMIKYDDKLCIVSRIRYIGTQISVAALHCAPTKAEGLKVLFDCINYAVSVTVDENTGEEESESECVCRDD